LDGGCSLLQLAFGRGQEHFGLRGVSLLNLPSKVLVEVAVLGLSFQLLVFFGQLINLTFRLLTDELQFPFIHHDLLPQINEQVTLFSQLLWVANLAELLFIFF
jgi:hypothetical protein